MFAYEETRNLSYIILRLGERNKLFCPSRNEPPLRQKEQATVKKKLSCPWALSRLVRDCTGIRTYQLPCSRRVVRSYHLLLTGGKCLRNTKAVRLKHNEREREREMYDNKLQHMYAMSLAWLAPARAHSATWYYIMASGHYSTPKMVKRWIMAKPGHHCKDVRSISVPEQ